MVNEGVWRVAQRLFGAVGERRHGVAEQMTIGIEALVHGAHYLSRMTAEHSMRHLNPVDVASPKPASDRSRTIRNVVAASVAAAVSVITVTYGQQRAADGVPVDAAGNPQYSTFSLCAIDPDTGQSGAAVTTRVPFVGRAVPHVRAGVGAVCTQASTRVEFGPQGLDLLAKGVAPQAVLEQLLTPDQQRESRQVGVINMKGEAAAHTGKQNGAWAGSRQGKNYTVQANIMVGPEVVEAVAATFEASDGSGMPLSERMILEHASASAPKPMMLPVHSMFSGPIPRAHAAASSASSA